MPFIPEVQRDLSGWEETHPKSKLQQLDLESNIGHIRPEGLGWLKPLPATASDEDIRKELAEKGVVHIKGVMPRDLVLDMRRRYFETVAPSGVLKAGTNPVDGIFVGGEVDPTDYVGPDNAGYVGKTPHNDHIKLAVDAHLAPWAVDFAENKHLRTMVKRIKPEWNNMITMRRHLFRSNMPQAQGASTGVHYDQIFLRGGPPTALTAWVPIGDCHPQQGGLMYLEDSVPLGMEIEKEFDRVARETLSDEERVKAYNANMTKTAMLSHDAGAFARDRADGRKWLIGDYEAGDAVFHDSYMIHASGANRDKEGRIRLSADLRFADKDQPHDTRWNQGPFFVGDGL